MAQRNQHLSFKYMEFVLRRKHFLTHVAVVTINSETVSFLKTLGRAKKGMPANKVTENVDKVRSQVQRSVAHVKERFKLSRETNFKWSRGYCFQENPRFSSPLRNGMNRLIEISLLYILCSLTKMSL